MCARTPGDLSPSFTAGSCGSTSQTGDCNLSGGAGNLDDATLVASLSGEEVGEGDSDVKVMGLELDADDGSDLKLTSVRLNFDQNTADNDNFDEYASDVSLWLGSTKLATVDADEFNEDNDYEKAVSINTCNEIPMDGTASLYVAVSAVDHLDTGDVTESWDVSIDNVRYVDAQGAVTTDDSTNDIGSTETFSFESFGTANDVELKMTEDSENPEAMVVEVDDTNSTDGVTLLKGTLKAEGSDIEVKEMTFSVDSTGGDVDEIASTYILLVDGDEVQTLNSSECDDAACDTSETYTFDDVDEMIDEGDSVDFELQADINGTDDHSEGSTLTAAIDNSDTSAEDQEGDDVTDLTGAVDG
jgi:hypothetical protein